MRETTIYFQQSVTINQYIQRLLTIAGLMLVSVPIGAHEYWLAPSHYRLPTPANVDIEIRNGEHFLGRRLPYIEGSDQPFRINAQEGLQILHHESTPALHQYERFSDFEAFLNEEGLQWIVTDHLKRGLPTTRVTEQFKRHAKSLIGVGSARGIDKPLGMELEIVALANPYVSKQQDMPVQLLYQGRPLANTQVSVFHRAQSELTFSKLFSDHKGQILLSIQKSGNYMLSAVHMRPTSAQTMLDTQAVWESLWTSLTFERSDNSQYQPSHPPRQSAQALSQ